MNIKALKRELKISNINFDFNFVRIMPRASHRNTDKRRINQVNENSKLKSESYEMRKLYVQKKDER